MDSSVPTPACSLLGRFRKRTSAAKSILLRIVRTKSPITRIGLVLPKIQCRLEYYPWLQAFARNFGNIQMQKCKKCPRFSIWKYHFLQSFAKGLVIMHQLSEHFFTLLTVLLQSCILHISFSYSCLSARLTLDLPQQPQRRHQKDSPLDAALRRE